MLTIANHLLLLLHMHMEGAEHAHKDVSVEQIVMRDVESTTRGVVTKVEAAGGPSREARELSM